MKVRFVSTTQQEVRDAFDWYEKEMPGVGYKFLEQLDRTVQRIAHYPESCAEYSKEIRRALLNRFPYGLWYCAERDEIVVYAVAHLHRQPRHWIDRNPSSK
ncbi:MAG TPA: type II toxin-antitoxin system RelE/ParE family toxin [bacterium]|nr:type II toxin-antitoxin system RelE/ParE family toxin [bacterium]HPO10533.1 type II toxin-antitoxin system RelE/ParE family toxin [bacterium]HQO35930.1 type II toxin-antitoxin system RelE/ParE family toxin [bacterium]HQP98155.1 type II toxin-antitoxin system RelE/ParE family toxin [bacterium]